MEIETNANKGNQIGFENTKVIDEPAQPPELQSEQQKESTEPTVMAGQLRFEAEF